MGRHKHQLEWPPRGSCCIYRWLNRQVKVARTFLWGRTSSKRLFSYCSGYLCKYPSFAKNSGKIQVVLVNIARWCSKSEDCANVTYCLGHLSIFSNYWMRLSRIWRILQIKEGVIHRGRRPRWITPSEICRILHILRKPNALLFIQNISPFLKELCHFALCFSAHQNNTNLSPGFFGQQFNNLHRAALLTSFWRHRLNNFQRAALLTSLV